MDSNKRDIFVFACVVKTIENQLPSSVEKALNLKKMEAISADTSPVLSVPSTPSTTPSLILKDLEPPALSDSDEMRQKAAEADRQRIAEELEARRLTEERQREHEKKLKRLHEIEIQRRYQAQLHRRLESMRNRSPLAVAIDTFAADLHMKKNDFILALRNLEQQAKDDPKAEKINQLTIELLGNLKTAASNEEKTALINHYRSQCQETDGWLVFKKLIDAVCVAGLTAFAVSTLGAGVGAVVLAGVTVGVIAGACLFKPKRDELTRLVVEVADKGIDSIPDNNLFFR